MRRFTTELRLYRAQSRWLGRVAVILTASIPVHIVAMTMTGGSLSGAVSYRKPITFALSFALLLWACGWVMDRLPPRRWLGGVIAVVLAVSAIVEVGLVAVQAWRGVPSHFNLATTFDAGVFGLMGVTILTSSMALVVLTLWAAIQRPRDPAMRLGILAGLAMVLAGLGLGVLVIQLGIEMLETSGRVPDTVLVGQAGVAKFPHALALHGLQLFIVTWAASSAAGLADAVRHRLMRLMVGGYGLLLVWSTLHTNAGRAPVDLTGAEAVALLTGIGLLAAAGVVFARHWRRGGLPLDVTGAAAGTLSPRA